VIYRAPHDARGQRTGILSSPLRELTGFCLAVDLHDTRLRWRAHLFHPTASRLWVGKAELVTAIEGVSSRPVRRIVLREG
jgi:hypothetical protein